LPRRYVSPEARALYERLVADGGLRLNDSSSGLDESQAAVRELIAAGYANASLARHGVKKLVAISPLAVYERMLLRYRRASIAHQQRISRLLDAAFALHLDDVRSQRLLGRRTATIIDDPIDVQLAVGQVLATATESAASWNTGPYRTPPPDESAVETAMLASPEAIRSGAQIRTLFSRDVTERPHDRDVVDASADNGEEVRVAERLPMKLVVADHRMVVLPLQPGGTPALFVGDTTIVRVFERFFDLIWQQAWPWNIGDTGAPTARSRRRHVLTLLAEGQKDEAIARHLGLSARTVRRYITDMMNELGATSRFAAGVAAVRAGWFDSP
jgi:DNA-binding CsgD family transcriptional regulator